MNNFIFIINRNMLIRTKVFVREEGFEYIQDCLSAARSLKKTDLKYYFLTLLVRFLQRCVAFFSSKTFSLEGHFKCLFFILDLSITALFSCLVIKGALFPRTIFYFKGACLSITSLKTDGNTAKPSSC